MRRQTQAPLNPQFAARRLANSVNEDDEDHGCLCFALGVLFGPLGLLLAAIIAKAKGLISALWGFLISWILAGIIWYGLVVLAARHRAKCAAAHFARRVPQIAVK